MIHDWNGLEDSLIRYLPSDQRAGKVNPAAQTDADLHKLVDLLEQTDAASLDALEPLAASLERSTSDLAGRTSALVERMGRSPPPLAKERSAAFA